MAALPGNRRALLAAALALLFSAPAPAKAPASEYSPLRPQDCAPPPADLLPRYRDRGLSAQECPGRFGYRLFVVSSDANSWIELEKAGVFWSSEQAIVYAKPIGQFPGIAEDSKAEWRLDGNGQPSALIVRVNALDPALSAQDARAKISRLYVFRLGTGQPCHLGTATGNRQARQMADGGRCGALDKP